MVYKIARDRKNNKNNKNCFANEINIKRILVLLNYCRKDSDIVWNQISFAFDNFNADHFSKLCQSLTTERGGKPQ